MSVLSCYIPDFLFALARRQAGQAEERPLALLGEDGGVAAASARARACGVSVGMNTRQALTRCPDLLLSPIDLRACETEHAALLGTLAQTGLPVEAQDWGSAYVDLREVTRTLPDAQPLCADLGKQVRRALGDLLQPALGWDTGKFTARAASVRSHPGQMRLVSQPDEERFLEPLPIGLLPLPEPALQQLDWLGIRTLGRFARLPQAAVQQRFGAAGKLAQQWAQGRDDRPVRATIHAVPDLLDVDVETPTSVQGLVVESAMRTLRPRLRDLSAQLEGCRRLHADLRFVDGGTRGFDHIFVEPVCAEAPLRAMLMQELARVTWTAELTGMQMMLLDVAELVPAQLSLFPELDAPQAAQAPFAQLTAKLTPRYGKVFWRGMVADALHPLAERRIRFEQQV